MFTMLVRLLERRPPKKWAIVAAVLFLAIAVFGLAFAPASESQDRGQVEAEVTVSRVVEGDTFDISPDIDGIDTVRLIGVDTPETRHPRCGAQPFGREASDFTRTELEDQQVELEFDVERVDQYDRLLAYVYPEGEEMFNERLLREGYGQLAIFPPNDRYVERFEDAQEEARTAGRGLWGLSAEDQAAQTNRGNGIGSGECGESETTQAQSSPPPPPQKSEPAPPPQPRPPTPAPPPPPQPNPSPAPPFKAGGSAEGPVPPMPNGSCPKEFPDRHGNACF